PQFADHAAVWQRLIHVCSPQGILDRVAGKARTKPCTTPYMVHCSKSSTHRISGNPHPQEMHAFPKPYCTFCAQKLGTLERLCYIRRRTHGSIVARRLALAADVRNL